MWGSSGVRKSRYAEWLCRNQKYVRLGSSRDFFQDYDGETYVILDDLRSKDFSYADLLRLMDPYIHDKVAPRRYHDRKLNLEMLIITTPYSPWEFYKECDIDNRKVDKFEQLKRRIYAVHVTREFVKEVLHEE